jgi:hypothetical protein
MTKLLLLAGLLLTAAAGYAQAPGTGGPTPNPAAVPLDGGSSLLLAAGVAYGVRQLRERRARRKQA